MTPPAVAEEILSYCTKCKMDLLHTIVAMQGDLVKKVQCKTCQGFHVFRAPKGLKEPGKAPKKRASASSQKVSVESEWERLMKIKPDAPMKPYSAKVHFSVGDKISHPVFGEGVVGKLIHPNKMEIVFRTDIKILIHSYA